MTEDALSQSRSLTGPLREPEPERRTLLVVPVTAITKKQDTDRSRESGKIADCANSGCNWRCCQFMQGNYIVLYPGEVAAAKGRGESLHHLDIFDDDYHGGSRATCFASDTASCDSGYKPLDCATYPFFPVIGEQSDTEAIEPTGGDANVAAEQRVIKWDFGQKCPLNPEELITHLDLMRAAWQDRMRADHRVAPWLRLVRLVGYKRHQSLG